MSDRINLSLRRADMVAFKTIEEGRRPVVHVAGRHVVALESPEERGRLVVFHGLSRPE